MGQKKVLKQPKTIKATKAVENYKHLNKNGTGPGLTFRSSGPFEEKDVSTAAFSLLASIA